MMNLNDFEIHIDEMILERGYDYSKMTVSYQWKKKKAMYEAKSRLWNIHWKLNWMMRRI